MADNDKPQETPESNEWQLIQPKGTNGFDAKKNEAKGKSTYVPTGNPRGRPKGRKNTPRGFKEVLSHFEEVYKRIEGMLTEDQRKYYESAFSGRVQFDPLKEGELFMRLMSLYTTTIVTEALTQKVASKDVADVVAQYRMGLKDMEDMARKREEAKVKSGDSDRLVDPTRESSLARFEALHRELPKGS